MQEVANSRARKNEGARSGSNRPIRIVSYTVATSVDSTPPVLILTKEEVARKIRDFLWEQPLIAGREWMDEYYAIKFNTDKERFRVALNYLKEIDKDIEEGPFSINSKLWIVRLKYHDYFDPEEAIGDFDKQIESQPKMTPYEREKWKEMARQELKARLGRRPLPNPRGTRPVPDPY